MTNSKKPSKINSSRFSNVKRLGLAALVAGSLIMPQESKAQGDSNQYIGVTAGWVNLGGDIGEVYPSGPVYGVLFAQESDPFKLEFQLNKMSSVAEQHSSGSYGFFSSGASQRSKSLDIISLDVNAIYRIMDMGIGIQGSYQNAQYNRNFYEQSRGFFSSGYVSDTEIRRETYVGYGAFLNFEKPLQNDTNVDFRIGFKQTRNQENTTTIDQGYGAVVYNFGLSNTKKQPKKK